MKVNVKLLNSESKLPVKCSDGAAGMDVHSREECEIGPGERKTIGTGIQMAIPSGFFGYLAGRSGHASQKGITVGGGIIDSDYRGEICVILFNLSDSIFKVRIGMKIAQLIVVPTASVEIHQTDALEQTGRGSNGFGSTGNY